MKKLLLLFLFVNFILMYGEHNQTPIIYNVKKDVKNNTITVTFQIFNREKEDNLTIYVINNKTDRVYRGENSFISGDIGKVNRKKFYNISILNHNFNNFFPILLCYDGNSLGTEMIVLRKTRYFTEYISKYETMNIQFNEFVQIGGYSDESNWHIYDKAITLKDLAWRYCTKYEWNAPKYWNLNDNPPYLHDPYSHYNCSPVVGVTWWEAMAYIEWIDGEIITRDDWARIVLNKDKFPTKNFNIINFSKFSPPFFPMANLRFSNSNYSYHGFTDDGFKYAAPVASYPPIIYNNQKIYDLIGNVFEWTGDVVAVIQYPEFTCADRYIVGGSYKSNVEQMTFPIIGLCPLYRTEAIGFRYKIKLKNKK